MAFQLIGYYHLRFVHCSVENEPESFCHFVRLFFFIFRLLSTLTKECLRSKKWAKNVWFRHFCRFSFHMFLNGIMMCSIFGTGQMIYKLKIRHIRMGLISGDILTHHYHFHHWYSLWMGHTSSTHNFPAFNRKNFPNLCDHLGFSKWFWVFCLPFFTFRVDDCCESDTASLSHTTKNTIQHNNLRSTNAVDPKILVHSCSFSVSIRKHTV